MSASGICQLTNFSHYISVDQELVKHLEEEISNEKKAEQKKVPGIEGWDVKSNGSEVILQKKHGDEM